jgi:hypothetical protein
VCVCVRVCVYVCVCVCVCVYVYRVLCLQVREVPHLMTREIDQRKGDIHNEMLNRSASTRHL